MVRKNRNTKSPRKQIATKEPQTKPRKSPRKTKPLRPMGPQSTFKDIDIKRFSMATPDGATPLLENTDLKISFGKRYGLVGKNGHGKTTLLNSMATSSIEGFPKDIKMLHVHQECKENDPRRVTDAVLEADNERTHLLNETERLEDLMYSQEDEEKTEEIQAELDRVNSRVEQLRLSDSHSRAYRILTGLGFSKAAQSSEVKALSGGWKMRVELAKALFVDPDLLLLDEPTNHLDFPAVLWLEEYLAKDFKKTLVVVSHDTMFLDEVTTHTIHLDHHDKTLSYYKGNYSAFEAAQNEQAQALANAYRAHEVQIKSIKDFVAKFKDKGEKRAAQVQSKLKTLKKLEESLPPKPRENKLLSFDFPDPSRFEQHLVLFEKVSFGYVEGRPVLNDINLAVTMDSRVGVIGANGIGKSTLVKLMLGKLEPSTGKAERLKKAKFAFFSQHHYEQLDMDKSAVEYFLERFAGELAGKKDQVQRVRKYLGRFKIQGDRQNQKMGLLSGGQKSRVAFASMAFISPHFIVMDEPTNHLDVETVNALLGALERFKGGVLVVSHDTNFLSKMANEFWVVTKEGIVLFDEFEEAKKFALKKRIGEVAEDVSK